MKMLKLPLVSFIVTSYNYSKYLEQTLLSIKNQIYKNFEIIIVDDFSSDNSVEIANRFVACNQDLRVTLIVHDKNLGQLSSMLDGLRAAQGVFVSFVDSDDIILPSFAQTHVKIHLNSSVAFTSAQIVEIDSENQIHTVKSVSSPNNTSFDELKDIDNILDVDFDNVKYEIVKNKPFGGWYWSPNSSAMFRRTAILPLLKFEYTNSWKICPDKFLFNFAHLVGGSINILAPLVGYRRHSDNAGNGQMVCGNRKFPSDKLSLIYLKNNIKIRPQTFKLLLQNKKSLIEKFGLRGYLYFLFKAISIF